MAKVQTYCMRADGEPDGEYRATTPARALREYYGERLASQDGRYGRLTNGATCMALLVHGGRKYYGRGDSARARGEGQ